VERFFWGSEVGVRLLRVKYLLLWAWGGKNYIYI